MKSKSRKFLVNTKSGNTSKTKYRYFNGEEKESDLGQNNPTNQLMNNDYNDMVTKQRNLNSKGRKHRRRFRNRKNHPKNGFINNQFREFGNDYNDWQTNYRNLTGQERKHGRGLGQKKKHSKNRSISQSIVINQSTNSNGWLSKYNHHNM